MNTKILVGDNWVTGKPVAGELYRQELQGGGSVTSYYSEPVAELPVWSVVDFLLIVGEDISYAIDKSKSKRNLYFSKLIANATKIDLNSEVYFELLRGFFETDHPKIWAALKGE